MTYKWTMPEVDEIEMPMLFALMEQIGETPPNDFLVNAQIKAQEQKLEREKKGALSEFNVERGKVRKRRSKDVD